MDLYSEQILEHYKHPQHRGVVESPDYDAEDSNPLCGDKIRFTMKQDASGKITDVGFTSSGCAISTAAASMLTEYVMEKNVERLQHMNPQEMLDLLGLKLTPARVQCALLAQAVMRKSILEKKYHLQKV